MRNELKKLTTKQLIELVKTFEHYPAVTLKDGKDYILSYLEDEACTISEDEIFQYLLKHGATITIDNIHLYYKFMSSDDLDQNSSLIWVVISNRLQLIIDKLVLDDTIYREDNDILLFDRVDNSKIGFSFFGIKETLKPIDEYVKEIKDSNAYKQYCFNYLVETYDLSISHLKRLEHELFADDSNYVSNIDNLIHTALDNVADDFKMNVINYIEENYLQEKTGINCISDIPVIIKDGEFQGIFKEFESYGLNDFSVQNITMFIDRYREIRALDENKTCIEKAL